MFCLDFGVDTIIIGPCFLCESIIAGGETLKVLSVSDKHLGKFGFLRKKFIAYWRVLGVCWDCCESVTATLCYGQQPAQQHVLGGQKMRVWKT